MKPVRRIALRAALHTLTLALHVTAQSPQQKSTLHFQPVPREVVELRLRQYAGTDAEREASLMRIFSEAGCGNDQLSQQSVKGAKTPNVTCTLPGTSSKVIVVGAHYDHIAAGAGVVDNWSGASLLPSLYQAIKSEPRKHTFIFVGFTDEEKGEVGSRFYARHLSKDQKANVEAMVNLDTLGLTPSEFWASHSDRGLYSDLLNVAHLMNLPVSGMNVEQVGSTDSEQFAQVKIPSITIHSLTQRTWDEHILHTSKDRFSAINLDNYYETYHLLSAYITFLDVALPSATAKNNRK